MKNNGSKKNLIIVVASLIALVAIGGLGVLAGAFDGFGELVGMVKLSSDKIFRVVIAVAFVVLISNVILIVLGILQEKKGRIGTLSSVISSLVKYAAVLIGFCWTLSIIGVNVSTIFASVGIVALILGFGAESLVADMVTGVFILFENQYNVGDIIEVGGFRGTVQEVGIRTISIVDGGGNVKIINNADMKNVINRSDLRSVAVSDIGVSYETNLDELDKVLPQIFEEIKKKHEDIFTDRIECLGVETLGDSAVTLRIIADVSEENIFKGRRILNKELKTAFDKHNISIPYPQLDVHTK